MYRPTVVGAIVLTATATAAAWAQAPKLVPPIYGEAKLEVTRPATKVSGNQVITTLNVKNMEAVPIAGLQIEEYWYDVNGQPLGATTYRHPKPLQPGEVITVTLKSDKTAKMNRNKVGFSHAHGTIKQTVVAKLDAPKT
jgi:flagellar basal body L-ring protein FlgH